MIIYNNSMNVVLTYNQFNKKHIYFSDPIDNSIIENSKFVKIIYSNQSFIMNGLCILLNININNTETYFKKLKYSFDMNLNKELISNIYNIEKQILTCYNVENKTHKYCIYDSLSNGYLKTFPQNSINDNSLNNTFILKISGIWESDKEIGLTFKIISN